MKIIQINWISQAGKEAELIISDGKYECLVFSQPCNHSLHENIVEPLHAIEIENLVKLIDENVETGIHKTNESYFSQRCIGNVTDIQKSIVTIGNIQLQLDMAMPNWLQNGDVVTFNCSRIDLW